LIKIQAKACNEFSVNSKTSACEQAAAKKTRSCFHFLIYRNIIFYSQNATFDVKYVAHQEILVFTNFCVIWAFYKIALLRP
jgi:hypothetical protein